MNPCDCFADKLLQRKILKKLKKYRGTFKLGNRQSLYGKLGKKELRRRFKNPPTERKHFNLVSKMDFIFHQRRKKKKKKKQT